MLCYRQEKIFRPAYRNMLNWRNRIGALASSPEGIYLTYLAGVS